MRNVKKILLWIGLFYIYNAMGVAQTFNLSDFVRAIEQNSIQLVDNKAQFESMLAEGKSNLEWEYPTIEADIGTATENGRMGADWTALLLFKPKLWWVNPLLRESLKTKGIQYQKSHILIRNINFIGAKKTYLTYIATKEKYRYFLKREENFLKLLSIAQKRLDGGSISQKDYVSFKSAYIDSTLASVAVRNELLELQKTLFMFVGLDKGNYGYRMELHDKADVLYHAQAKTPKIDYEVQEEMQEIEEEIKHIDKYTQTHNPTKIFDDDILVNDLHFSYIDLSKDVLQTKLNESLYTEILDLQAKEYQSLGKYEGRNHWGTLELGAGVNYSLSNYNPKFQVTLPLPVSKKQSHLKAKYMTLESGALTKANITKKQIAIKANAYLHELIVQKRYIDIAKNNVEVKQHLANLNRLGYEAQQVTLFEYITQENAFVDSQIELVNSQIQYINLVALLEETLGESFTKID